MSGDQFALVIEGVEQVYLDRDSEYFIRAGLGQLKVGTQWTTIENHALQYNAHTMMPIECGDDPNLSLELINSNDEVVGARRVMDWKKRMNDLVKGVLKVGLYPPDLYLVNEASPIAQRDVEGNVVVPKPRPVGIARVRLYLSPRYKELQEKYDRLDVYIGRLSDVIVKEILTERPHVLVSLGSTTGVALPGTAKPIDNDDGWEWDETLSFLYRGESELVVSVREPVSDRELGRGRLFLSQVAYNLNKLKFATGASHRSDLKTNRDGSQKMAGSIPICDDYGAHIGLLMLGAELWSHENFHKKLSGRMNESLPALERRLEFDEALFKALVKDGNEAEAAVAEAEGAVLESPDLTNRLSSGGRGRSPDENLTPGRVLPDSEYQLTAGRLSEIRNSLERLKLEHTGPHQELISRRELRKLKDRELNDAREVHQHLRDSETRLFEIACDIARALDRVTVANCENARSVVRRCRLDLASSPRHMAKPVDIDELNSRVEEARVFEERSKEMKQRVYSPERLNDVLPAIDELAKCVRDSRQLHLGLMHANDTIRQRNEEARRALRLENVRAREMRYDQLPPVVVERTGLNCFGCCMPPQSDLAGQLDIIGPEPLAEVDRLTESAAA